MSDFLFFYLTDVKGDGRDEAVFVGSSNLDVLDPASPLVRVVEYPE